MSVINIKKPRLRWLFGGVGFHNSEATMTALMSEKQKNEIFLKTFREISPTYSRVFAGYADWTKEAMDAFADYYDLTFRNADTLLYVVPGRIPMFNSDFNIEEYSEKVALNLEYLIKERNCTKIRYYCATNELSVGNTYAYLSNRLELFKELHENLYKAFKRHNLDIGLLATDCSGVENYGQIEWATQNIDEITECYCAHLYSAKYAPGDLNAYKYYSNSFSSVVAQALQKEKRFTLGEYGIITPDGKKKSPMRNDSSYGVDLPDNDGIFAIGLCEMAMAAINSGCFSAVSWTMFDYPDPFIRENADSKEGKAKYDAARFSGHGIDIRYNKHGMVKWCDDDNDYGSRAALYAMGYMAKLFKKGTRVLKSSWEDENIRCCAVTCPDGSISIAVINWSEQENSVSFNIEHKIDKPLRKYEYKAGSIPFNSFNDLQYYSELIEVKEQSFSAILPAKSVTFLTSDYVDRVPSTIKGIKYSKGKLTWKPSADPEHCYYRVYCNGKQIASTVAEYVYAEKPANYQVYSVDKYGNCQDK
ncbi:MAG: hypothetical protein IJ946_03530 [Clostridia bacterium]|nr:hypothetical protein [Clostridia bacterium]